MSSSRVILVTGAGGFLGRYIAREFGMQGWRVIGVDLAPESPLEDSLGHEYHQMDVSDPALRGLLKSEMPTACVHCAGSASVPLSMVEPLQDFRLNVSMTAELLEAIRVSSPDCALILLSSAAVYGSPSVLPIAEDAPVRPISSYGFHKYMAEQLCAEFSNLHGLRTACVRIFSAYGPGLRRQVLWDLCSKLISGGDVVLQGTGAESRDFAHATDIARAVRVVVEGGALQGEFYNVASGTETPISILAEMLSSAMQVTRPIRFDGYLPAGIPTRWRADIGRLRSLGFLPEMTIEQGALDYACWVRTVLSAR